MASYGNIFQFTILSQNGDDVDIFISKKNYSGPLMQRPLGRAPILKREANGNILGTSLEIYAECRSDQEYAGLYTSSADEFLVELYKNRVLQWTGFISPELYAEPDLAPPYDVQIIATDGLGELKNYAFTQEDNRPKSYLGHLRTILQHTGSDLEITTISSLQYSDDEEWSGNLLSIVADFGHLTKDNAYNALQAILASVNATITQQAGKWLIVRSSDIYDHISEMNPVQFGSMNSCNWWPIGNLSTDILPAKRHLILTSSNAYKPTVLQNSLMESDESWVKEFGARYDDNERAFILPAANSGIVQSVSFEQEVGYQLYLRISARNIGDSQESQVLGVSVKIDGRTYQAGNQFWLTRLAGFDSRYVWRNYEGYIEIDLPEPSASDTKSDASNIDIVIPLYKYDSRSYAYATAVEVRLFNPVGLYDIGVYECSLMQYAQTAGKQIEVAILNNARENATTVELGLGDGDYAFPAAEVFRYALPLGYNSESIIRRWRTSSLTESGYLPLMARDYAVQIAKPRIRYRGKLNVPSSALPNIPLLFQRDNTYYILNTYTYDLLLDEIEVELISIPNATVAIESERVEDIVSGAAMSNPSGGSAGGEGSGGSASATLAGLNDVQTASPSENDALVYNADLGKWVNKALDTEMSGTSTNPVQNKVIKAYIDDKDEYVLGYAEGLVDGLEKWVIDQKYLTSAAMGNYATKDEIKDFVTKGTTLAHYGITDAVKYAIYFPALTTDTPKTMGYCRLADGWKLTGPAMILGTNNYYARIQADTSSMDNPALYLSVVHAGVEYGWAQVVTDKNFSAYGLAMKPNQNGIDLNEIEVGLYDLAGAISNSPLNYGSLLNIKGYFSAQLLFNASGDAAYYRTKSDREVDGTKWRPWRTIIDSNNVSSYVQSAADSRYLKLSGGTLTGQLYVETSAGDRYIHSKCSTAHIAFGVGSGGNNRGIYDVKDSKWWIVRNDSDYTEIVSSTISLVGNVNVTGVLEARSGIKLGSVTRTSWPTEGITKDSILLPNNAFDNFGKIQFSQLDNALYAADRRFNVTVNGFASAETYKLFNGNYEDTLQVPMGQTGTILIDNDNKDIISGYPYGKIVLSFYYTSVPESVDVRVYTTYGTPGWYSLPLSEVRGANGGVFIFDNANRYYAVKQVEITITAKANTNAALGQIDWFLSRASLSNLPVVTKFAIDQELWGNLICKGGITLGNKTITSWSEIGGSGGGNCITSDGGTINAGKYLYFGDASLVYRTTADGLTKLVISGLTEVGNLYVRERIWMEMNSDSRFGFRNSSTGESQSISSFSDLKTILGLGSLAYKSSVAFSDIASKPATLSGYGITDAVINGNFVTPDSPAPTLGFATTANGWPYHGAAIMVGDKGAGQLRLISTLGEGYMPDIFVSGRYLNNESVWCRIMTDKNLGSFSMASEGNGRELLTTDNRAVTSYVFGTNGWKTTGPAMAFAHGRYKALLNVRMYDPSTTDNGATAYLGIAYEGVQGMWSKILTEHNISDYALSSNGGTINGSLTVTGGITLGNETITSWANVRSNWGFRGAGLNNQTNVQFDINIRQRTTIVTTLTQDHTVTFNLIGEANTNNEWVIIFTTGTTVPKVGLISGSATLYWQNKQNILNNLSPNTTYRIYIDANLVMYETF